jgi:serine/threonine-protein kinase HipA
LSRLNVLAEASRVGVLDEREGGGLRFTYVPAWLVAAERFAISRSLPLRDTAFESEADRFFGNLLPEGTVRTAVSRRLGLSEDNDFALLAAIGRECAGALSLIPDDGDPAEPAGYRRIGDDELERWSSTGGYAAAVVAELRLSLAGAQDKLGVVVDDDALLLPERGAPSTHLLKLPSRDFAALPENEALVLELARRVGLPTVDSRLWTHAPTPVLLVARFDRTPAPDLRRLHQEDACQAVGIDRRHKYEAEGGPSFAAVLDMVRETSAQPLRDARSLLQWLAFCLVVGNRDNHGKNLALLRTAPGQWRLAPFYDLVCTTAYDRLSRRLAMTIGGRADGGNLPAAAWVELARAIGVKAKLVLAIAAEVTDAIEHELPGAVGAIAKQLGRDDALVVTRQAITKGVRSVRRGLRTTIA